jgi:hypothetical protein
MQWHKSGKTEYLLKTSIKIDWIKPS